MIGPLPQQAHRVLSLVSFLLGGDAEALQLIFGSLDPTAQAMLTKSYAARNVHLIDGSSLRAPDCTGQVIMTSPSSLGQQPR